MDAPQAPRLCRPEPTREDAAEIRAPHARGESDRSEPGPERNSTRAYSRADYDHLRGQQRAFTFAQLFLGEQAALALCAQLLNQGPEMETKLCLAGQVIDEARHVEVFGNISTSSATTPRSIPPFGPINEFLQSTLDDSAHRLRLIGLELRQ